MLQHNDAHHRLLRTSLAMDLVSIVMLKHNLRLRRCLLVLALCAATLGCGGGSSKTAGVSGRVTYKGKPVAKANVSFTPTEGAGRAASGLTDGNGYYTLG